MEDLEVIRAQAGLSVVLLCALLGMPRATWYRWRAAVNGGAARIPARSCHGSNLSRVGASRNPGAIHTGELTPVVVVTDNGPAYRSVGFAHFIASRPELLHVRTRYRSPQTNGVIERFYQAIKYEHLYRPQINDGLVLAREVEIYLTIYNTIRPHEAIGFATPISRYLQAPSTPPGTNLQAPATVSDS